MTEQDIELDTISVTDDNVYVQWMFIRGRDYILNQRNYFDTLNKCVMLSMINKTLNVCESFM